MLDHLAGRDLGHLREEARAAVQWVAKRLRPDDRSLIARWSATLGLDGVFFCHATPRSDTEIFTRHTAEQRLLPIFGDLDVPLVVCGHTHMQFDRRVGRTRVVNAGRATRRTESPPRMR